MSRKKVLNSFFITKKEKNKSLPTNHDNDKLSLSNTSETASGVPSSSLIFSIYEDEKNMQEDSKKIISKIKIDSQTFDIEIDMQNAKIECYSIIRNIILFF